jgi:hypothetical protein
VSLKGSAGQLHRPAFKEQAFTPAALRPCREPCRGQPVHTGTGWTDNVKRIAHSISIAKNRTGADLKRLWCLDSVRLFLIDGFLVPRLPSECARVVTKEPDESFRWFEGEN